LKIVTIELVLALPNELWVQRWISWVSELTRQALLQIHKMSLLAGWDIDPLVVMLNRFDRSRAGNLLLGWHA
jgi:hypothetical protein